LVTNTKNAFATIAQVAANVVTNFSYNMAVLAANIPKVLVGAMNLDELRGKLKDLVTSVDIAFTAFPEAAKRELTITEKISRVALDLMRGDLESTFAMFRWKRLSELYSKPLEDTKEAADDATKSVEALRRSLTKFEAVEVGGAEAAFRALSMTLTGGIEGGGGKEPGGKAGPSKGAATAAGSAEAADAEAGAAVQGGDEMASISKGIDRLVVIESKMLERSKFAVQLSPAGLV